MITPTAAPPAAMPFLAACRRQPVPHTPIWIMRQAGRYLPEYRQLRAQAQFTTLLRNPQLAAEVTLQPLRRFPLDAAILFSDIMTPLQGMGVDLAFEPGPVVREPIRTDAAMQALPPLVPERDVPFVLESVRLVRAGAAARRAADRLRRRPVHAAVLSGLRQAVEGVRSGALVSLQPARERPSGCSIGSRMPWPSTCAPRPPPERRR